MIINCIIFILTFKMAVPVRFLLKSFPTILTYFIIKFLLLPQFLSGTIFHKTNNFTFKSGFRRASSCRTVIFSFTSSYKTLFMSTFCSFIIKSLFMYISVVSIGDVFTTSLPPTSEHFAFNWCHDYSSGTKRSFMIVENNFCTK